jgi:hypothetical protein
MNLQGLVQSFRNTNEKEESNVKSIKSDQPGHE